MTISVHSAKEFASHVSSILQISVKLVKNLIHTLPTQLNNALDVQTLDADIATLITKITVMNVGKELH